MEFLMVALRAAGITFVSVYGNPRCHTETMKELLNTLQAKCTGWTIAMGDWNARQDKWDKRSNAKGWLLVKWAKKNVWTIKAPSEPTFVLPQGIRMWIFFVHRACDVQNLRVANDAREGSNDHEPVIAWLSSDDRRTNPKRRVSKAWRKRDDLSKSATERYATPMPKYIDFFKVNQKFEELNMIYDKLETELATTFRPSGKPPSELRARYFWTSEMEHMSKIRRWWYKKVVRSNIEKWTRISRDRCAQRTAQRRNFRKFVNEIATWNDSAGTSSISNIVKVQRRNGPRNELIPRADVNLKDFTAHVANKFPPKCTGTPIVGEMFTSKTCERHNTICDYRIHKFKSRCARWNF